MKSVLFSQANLLNEFEFVIVLNPTEDSTVFFGKSQEIGVKNEKSGIAQFRLQGKRIRNRGNAAAFGGGGV
jgi:hypothetical protein